MPAVPLRRLLAVVAVLALAAVPVGASAWQQDSASAERSLHVIPFASGAVDPALDWRESDPAERDLVLVQWERFGDSATLREIAATGALLVQPLAPVSYLVWADADEVRAIRELEAVRFAGVLPPEARVAPSVRPTTTMLRVTFVGAADVSGLTDVTVQERAFTQLGGAVATVPGGLSEALAFARLPRVYSVADAGGPPELRDEKAAQVVAVGTDQPVEPGYRDFVERVGADGSDVIVSVVDTGIDFNHPDLAGRRHACLDYGYGQGVPCTAGSSDDAIGHGTHVAGIVAGEGVTPFGDLDGFDYGLSMAPGAGLISQNAISLHRDGNPFAEGYRPVYRDAHDLGAIISQNSWGPSGKPQGYDAATREFDTIVRDINDDEAGDQPMLLVFSIMNGSGGTSTQGSPDEAKNILGVGATGNRGLNAPGLDDLCTCSAHGPALDGRLLPDLVAPGTQVISTRASNGVLCGMPFVGWVPTTPAMETPPSPLHAGCTGTSMASPHASGAAAVFTDWFRQNVDADATPSPALVKAALINGAVDLSAYGGEDADGVPLEPIPNNQQGWGRLHLGNVIDAWQAGTVFVDQEVAFTDSGEHLTTTVEVTDPTQPLKASLVWTDAPGHGEGGEKMALVNDLDLVVTAPDGATYLGNVFSDGFSTTGGEPDRLNNVENVYVADVEAGTYTITVDAANIIGQASPSADSLTWQDFALVVTNATEVESQVAEVRTARAQERAAVELPVRRR